VRAAALLVLLAGGVASAETLTGPWSSPLGAVKLTQQGDRIVATARRNPFCSLPSSGHFLEGDLLEDSLSGQVFVCFTACDRGPAWVPVLLLVAPDGQSLSGTSTLPKGCKASFGALDGAGGGAAGGSDGSLVLRRMEAQENLADDFGSADAPAPAAANPAAKHSAKPVAATAPGAPHSQAPAARESADARERALSLARDGAAFQDEGKFEQARKRFLEAIDADPLYAEGYNGVGVTFFARNDLTEALRWYKKALGVNPSFGDAYYNMACVYALQKRSGLALRYLKTAFHKGYTSRETLSTDPDLASLHGDPTFEALVGEPQ
jgi:hypothetical protein